MIDLVMCEGRAVWMQRDPETLQWKQNKVANKKDHRIMRWTNQEEERHHFVESKKRKFIDL
tara:strand:+ start:1532 stop:1714 length:183 start_codon:yes stop_codon:yes gene_type:complete